MMIRNFMHEISCDGSSLWGGYKGEIQCFNFIVCDSDPADGVVSVYLSHLPFGGIVYTDKAFISSVRTILVEGYGMSREVVDTLDYSEQGMQDYDCVHLFADAAFEDEFFEKVYKGEIDD